MSYQKVKMEVSLKSWIFIGICLTSLATGVWLIVNMRAATQLTSDSEAPPESRPTSQNVSVQKVSPAQPAVPTPKDSILENYNSPIVERAIRLLTLPAGPSRTQQWEELAKKSCYEELVRLTELPLKPALDDDRTHLRYLAVNQMGALGLLERFTKDRHTFDNNYWGSSKILRIAMQEWARINPKACVNAWSLRMMPLFKLNAEKELTEAVAKGLVEAKEDEMQAALASVTEIHFNKLLKAMEVLAEPEKK